MSEQSDQKRREVNEANDVNDANSVKADSRGAHPGSGGGGAGQRGAWVLLVLGLAMIGGAAWFLVRMKDFQRLGQPGVTVVSQRVLGDNGELVATNAVALPVDVPGYRGTNGTISRTEYEWLPRDTTYGRVEYSSPDGVRMLMSAVLMGVDRTSIHKPEYCLSGQGFSIDTHVSDRISIGGPVPYELPVKKMFATRDVTRPDGTVVRMRVVYVFWFVADGQVSADHNQRMFSMAWDLVTTGVLQRWAYIACLAECPEGGEEALYARMSKLIAATVPRFQHPPGKQVAAARPDILGHDRVPSGGRVAGVTGGLAPDGTAPAVGSELAALGGTGEARVPGKNRDVTSRSTN